jgi:hypothetical protein
MTAERRPAPGSGGFWSMWKGPGKKRQCRTPVCKRHGVTKVRQHGRAPYRCPECEREAQEAIYGGNR